MKHVAAVLLLWLIAIAATFLQVRDPHTLTTLGPVYAICTIGSVLNVRAALQRRP